MKRIIRFFVKLNKIDVSLNNEERAKRKSELKQNIISFLLLNIKAKLRLKSLTIRYYSKSIQPRLGPHRKKDGTAT
jgi:hypothetical protein